MPAVAPQLRVLAPVPARLVLAASRGATRSGALAIYHPRRRLARAAAVAAGLRLRLGRGRIAQPPDWLDAVLEACDVQVEQVAVLHTAAGRVVVGVQSGGRLLAVFKGAPAGDAGIRNEQAHLTRLAAADAGVSPELLWAGASRGWDVVATRGVEVVREPVEQDVLALAVRLARLGVVHGDLAPWNVLVGPRGAVACDWEAAVEEFLPLYDLTHYYAQVGALLGQVTAAEAADRLTSAGGPASQLIAAIGGDPGEHPRWLEAALDRLLAAPADPAVRAFRAEVARRCRQGLATR
jgi:hypothetical protein